MCLALGWPHPDYLLELLNADQLADWIDYSSREPFGFPIEDLRGAMQMAITANAAGAELETADFQLADRFRNGPDNEDGTPSADALMQMIEKLMPPSKPPIPQPPQE